MKEEIRQAYQAALEKKLAEARASYETAKKDTIEAEGRMVTRYDSTKTETAWLADGYMETVRVLEQALSNLQGESPYINVGDRVTVDLFEGGVYEGSKELTVERADSDWPAFSCTLIGKKTGEEVKLKQGGRNLTYQIRSRENGKTDDRIALYSLVALKDSIGEVEWYYLVPEQGGMELMADGETVFCISGLTPLAQHLLDRRLGEQVEINGDLFEILSLENIL